MYTRGVQRNQKLLGPPVTALHRPITSGFHGDWSYSWFQFTKISEYQSSSQFQSWNRPPRSDTHTHIYLKKIIADFQWKWVLLACLLPFAFCHLSHGPQIGNKRKKSYPHLTLTVKVSCGHAFNSVVALQTCNCPMPCLWPSLTSHIKLSPHLQLYCWVVNSQPSEILYLRVLILFVVVDEFDFRPPVLQIMLGFVSLWLVVAVCFCSNCDSRWFYAYLSLYK